MSNDEPKISLVYLYQKNIGSRKTHDINFSKHKHAPSESALSLVIVRPNRDWAWQCSKPRELGLVLVRPSHK